MGYGISGDKETWSADLTLTQIFISSFHAEN